MANELSDSRLNEFLAALRSRPMGAAPPLPDLAPVRQVDRTAELAALFTRHALRAGMSVRTCGRAEMGGALNEELRRMSIGSAELAFDESTPLAAALAAAQSDCEISGIRFVRPSGDEIWFSADAGITTVAAAVAETGSLLVASGPRTPRSTSLIPPVHVALVAASQIVPDLVDALALLDAHDLPAGIALITGPSKTADIEGVLVTGVHGPRSVIVILVADA